jgi:hypothetical protein
MSIELRPEYIFPTNAFLSGTNKEGKSMTWGTSVHLRYAFRHKPESPVDRMFDGVYQGIGLAQYNFGNRKELGNPTALYLFQGARLARFSPRLSLNYEWNFGVTFGWVPYHRETNNDNRIIGSKVNAYLHAGISLDWSVCKEVDLYLGANASHFSNGNTELPNAGLNTTAVRVGISYFFNRNADELTASALDRRHANTGMPPFPKHISYDLTLFGSWRRAGIQVEDKQIAAPQRFGVFGFNFAPMYNFSYRFRAGLSLDGVYDESSNIKVEAADHIVQTDRPDEHQVIPVELIRPSFGKQLGFGLSARAEYVMPYFNVGVGLGRHLVGSGKPFRGWYQVLSIKMKVTRSSYLHVGYQLKNFHNPSFLMLGIGYRFHNKYPRLK